MARFCKIQITIGAIKLDFCHEVEVVNSLTELTNTATISLPKKVSIVDTNSQKNIAEVIKVKQPVKIRIGYDTEANMVTEFIGYVSTSPQPSIPFVINCQDEMFMLKNKSVANKSWDNATVKEVIEHIAPEYNNDILNYEIGKFIIGLNGVETAAKVLKRLQENHGIKSFFRIGADDAPVLVVAKPFMWSLENDPNLGEVVYSIAGKDCNTKGNTLKYTKAEDRLIKIEAKVIKPDGSTIEAQFKGDAEGDVRTLHYSNISATELEKRAKEDYQFIKRDGYEGTVTGFHIPVSKPGMKARILDQLYENIDEKYFIDKVVVKFYDGGIDRINTISYRTA